MFAKLSQRMKVSEPILTIYRNDTIRLNTSSTKVIQSGGRIIFDRAGWGDNKQDQILLCGRDALWGGEFDYFLSNGSFVSRSVSKILRECFHLDPKHTYYLKLHLDFVSSEYGQSAFFTVQEPYAKV